VIAAVSEQVEAEVQGKILIVNAPLAMKNIAGLILMLEV
jgi:hypothetical protein